MGNRRQLGATEIRRSLAYHAHRALVGNGFTATATVSEMHLFILNHFVSTDTLKNRCSESMFAQSTAESRVCLPFTTGW